MGTLRFAFMVRRRYRLNKILRQQRSGRQYIRSIERFGATIAGKEGNRSCGFHMHRTIIYRVGIDRIAGYLRLFCVCARTGFLASISRVERYFFDRAGRKMLINHLFGIRIRERNIAFLLRRNS